MPETELWAGHATIFVCGIVLLVVWLIFLIGIITSVILTGQKIEGIAAITFLLLGATAASMTLYEIPNLQSGYLYSMGRKTEMKYAGN